MSQLLPASPMICQLLRQIQDFDYSCVNSLRGSPSMFYRYRSEWTDLNNGHRAETGASSVMDQLTRYRGESDGGWLLAVATSWENNRFEGPASFSSISKKCPILRYVP